MTADDLEEIRERKREQLRERLDDEASTGSSGDRSRGSGGEGRDGAPDEPVPVTGQAEFSDLVANHDVVLVDFYADWCGPCQQLEPTVEQIACETPAAVGKVDVDANQELAGQYGVRGVPTLLLFVDGEMAEQLVGVRDAGTLVDLVEQYT